MSVHDAFEEAFDRIRAFQADLNTSLNAFGGELRCIECGRVTPMSEDDASHYTAQGWPRCCGYTMRWVTRRQIEEGM